MCVCVCLYRHLHHLLKRAHLLSCAQTHTPILLNFQSPFLFSPPLAFAPWHHFPLLCVAPFFHFHLSLISFHLTLSYSLILYPVPSNSTTPTTQTSMETFLLACIYPCFPSFAPSLFFPFLVSLGQLAASFSLLKVVFKLETLQSPQTPLPLLASSLSYFFFLARGDSHLSLPIASRVPSMLGNFVL